MLRPSDYSKIIDMNQRILPKNVKILLVGGHLTPALSVLKELRRRGYSNFIWVGVKYNQAGNKELSQEYKIIQSENIKFLNLKSGKLIRAIGPSNFFYAIKQFFFLILGFIQAFFIVLKNRPKVILSFGGYLAVPIAIWGRILGVKVITHEQTMAIGLANKIIGKFANKVLLSWERNLSEYSAKKAVLIGNPIRKELLVKVEKNITKDLDPKLPTILIWGGNQGANEINRRIFLILSRLMIVANVIHQTGNSSVTKDYQKALSIKEALPENQINRYIVKDFFNTDEVSEVLQNSDLLFNRAGANTITEILALGKLTIIMPIPWVSGNEQFLNAKVVEETGLGFILEQKDNLSHETVYQTILLGLNQAKQHKGFNNKDLDECKELASKMINLDAPNLFVDEMEKLLA